MEFRILQVRGARLPDGRVAYQVFVDNERRKRQITFVEAEKFVFVHPVNDNDIVIEEHPIQTFRSTGKDWKAAYRQNHS